MTAIMKASQNLTTNPYKTWRPKSTATVLTPNLTQSLSTTNSWSILATNCLTSVQIPTTLSTQIKLLHFFTLPFPSPFWIPFASFNSSHTSKNSSPFLTLFYAWNTIMPPSTLSRSSFAPKMISTFRPLSLSSSKRHCGMKLKRFFLMRDTFLSSWPFTLLSSSFLATCPVLKWLLIPISALNFPIQ